MCTVAFVPLATGGFVLGHNRDESRARARGVPPVAYRADGRRIVAPSDPDAGGTWIGVHDGGLAVCVLNANERDASRLPATPRSRGLVLRELLPLGDSGAIERRLGDAIGSLRLVRSFHLVVAEPGGGGRPARSVRFRWDGERLDREDHAGPELYVSSSLDPTGAERERSRSWSRLLRGDPRPDADRLRDWLASHEPERGPLSVCMHRPEARTVSRTLVRVTGAGIEMAYLDGSPCDPRAEEVVIRL